MSSPAIDMKEPQRRLNGALWASSTPSHHGRISMRLAIGAALLIELLLIVGVSHVKFQQDPPPAPKEMRVQIAPPPPPPPPEVKKIEPPPAPEPQKTVPKQVQPKPLPVPKPPPAKPSAAPKEANIPAAANPAANAPALATAPPSATPAPATAATGTAPVAPPALHGVVDGRGHCQSVQPQIPRRALEQGISANVLAHLSINADGSVGEVKIVRVTPPTTVFNEAVIAAGRAYKCEKNAEPYVGEVEFSFKTTASDDD
ncbi:MULTISPECIES: energy transducer TonB [Paraburkholderia]|jgi:protein TonB|uniref:Energy transducer TonB n=1 Tax=Paraburkholderia caribensis TaxID=75105 RepID=A0A9Q6SAP2_9BURK|nr:MULTISPECIES: energy transducer TonB [Paraburkholderia]ALP67567.1 energy transducer TonB [Paraburkholderia caribensis]AMV48646.1 energy transducer TonB [Paraburkholderia caribensis]AUT57300.1 energy transducer TonB [Paraburkholderia caribensis]MDR6380640.1 protein TonB [Paraburkholderia caribensis]QLB67229.1 energy transducer TonB [Paraburkholderia caribensis]